ncbi:hypothetical protein F52700_10715 [Fusarium sp. NRRL 52700]|nr:hypothetical protein F52700_10715 [Fusarium sp. NRRL 52700]
MSELQLLLLRAYPALQLRRSDVYSKSSLVCDGRIGPRRNEMHRIYGTVTNLVHQPHRASLPPTITLQTGRMYGVAAATIDLVPLGLHMAISTAPVLNSPSDGLN